MISSKNISEENTNDKNIEDLYAKVIRRKKPKNTSIQETILMVECKPNEILNETTTSDQLSTIHQENQSNEITNVEPSNTIYQEISLNEITNIDKLNRMYQDSQPNVIPTANILYNSRKNEILSVGDTSGWPKKSNIGSYDETVFCYNQHTNVFRELENVDHLTTRCEKMLGHDYTKRHNEVGRCIHLLLLNIYKFKSSKRIRCHLIQEIFDNEYAEIRVDTRIKTDICILDNRKNKITLIERKKLRKYDLLANELDLFIIPKNVEAYIKYIVLKKAVENISFDQRRGLNSGPKSEESLKEPRINTNEKTDSEEEQMMVVPMEEIISVFFEEKGAYLFKFDRKNDVLDQCKRNLQYAGKDCFS
ncbi:hypothetical protein CWI38_0559p0020 [Hamiltosporidium tvaerminnensis]|uniref:Uncharacterized protein n=1 Tax=Hamiltosporidium tvaerminnensis TaxID=1176355 RepID=A0A4Q9LXB7_9MICR|nr:hypothetical protein CWI38_0559p0020 [Hamiltosporidium tvaerminnensis]